MLVALCMHRADEVPAIQTLLSRYEEAHPTLSVKCSAFSTGGGLLSTISRCQTGFDLYLIDLDLGRESGLELARRLREMGERRRIVFFSHSAGCAADVLSINAAGYLLKPVQWEDFSAMMDQYAGELYLGRNRRRNQYMFHTPDGLHTIAAEDIVFVEIMGHAPYYHLTGETIRGSELRVSFEKGMEGLCRLGRFLRPHRSFLVNAAHIQSYRRGVLWMDEGSIIPVSRNRTAEFRTAYQAYLSAQPDA